MSDEEEARREGDRLCAIGYRHENDVGDPEAALGYYLKALASYRKINNGANRAAASTLCDVSTFFHSLGDLDQALLYCADALSTYLDIHGHEADHENIAQMHYKTGVIHDDMMSFDKALESFSKADAMYARLSGPDTPTPRRAEVLRDIAFVYAQKQDNKKTLEWGGRALQMFIDLLHQKTNNSNPDNALHSHQQEDPEQERAAHGQSEQGTKVDQTPKTSSEALDYLCEVSDLFNRLAFVAEDMDEPGALHTALDFYTKALALKRQLRLPREEIPITFSIASVLSRMNQFVPALSYCAESLRQSRELYGENSEEVADGLFSTATILCSNEQYDESISHFHAALDIYKVLFGPVDVNVANTLHSIGSVHHLKGDPAAALLVLTEAKELKEKLFRDDEQQQHQSLISTRNLIAQVLREAGRYDEALQHFREIHELLVSLHGPSHIDVSLVLYNTALVHKKRGEYVQALELLRQSRRIYAEYYGQAHDQDQVNNDAANNEDSADIVFEIGAVHEAQGEWDQAILHLKRSIEIYSRSTFSTKDLGESFFHLGKALIGKGDKENAIAALRRSLEAYSAHYGVDSPKKQVAEVLRFLGALLCQDQNETQSNDNVEGLSMMQRSQQILDALSLS